MAPLAKLDDPRTWRTDASHLDGLNTAAVVTDAHGRIVYLNAAADALLERPRDQLVGGDFVALLLPESHAGAGHEIFAQAFAGVSWSGQLPSSDQRGTERVLDVSASPLRRDGQPVGVLFVLEDASGQSPARGRAQRVAARLTRLARVTAELVYADDIETVSRIVISHAADAAGATIASLIRKVDDDTLALIGIRGASQEIATKYATFPLSLPTPAGECVRTGQPVLLTGREAIDRRYPDLDVASPGERTLGCFPLTAGNRTVGVITLSFPGRRTFDSTEQEFLRLLADTCAQAMVRIEAMSDAAERARKLAFLAQASAELSTSLDYEATLRKVAWIGVPDFADWCSVSLLEDGVLRTLEVAHVDPDKVAFAREIERRYPPNPDAQHGSWHVIRTGESELLHEITDELLVAAAQDEEHLRLARELNLRSAVTAPLVAHGRVLGVMTWVSSHEQRLFTTADLAFVENVAQRAAIAIDNAQLHSQTREAAVRLQRAVLPERLEPMGGWEFAGYYSPSGRTDVGGDFYDVLSLGDKVAFFVGDVMGRGVEAAAAMAQMRATVRSYVAIDPTPENVMGKLDTMFAMYDYGQLVTLVYVLADPARDELRIVNAGHPPPVLLRATGETDELSDAVSAPLGAGPQERTAFTVPMHEGDTLLMFTDGLIERRDEDIDLGQARLAETAAKLRDGDLSLRLEHLVETVRDHTREDDVAALAARRLPLI
ncbi:SpoIIE family protein phosphatase [Nocardioides sp. WL0053]|uniref:SpoIIE family protein phosphatase n=1 Tax=Nocardioides jiangsuensis TaxID=2866161 RepID=A0ABS7RM89_9ACTN|nr:SpoIIE family protein phosphatase [Nocardioides jiangsuensis]MBY9076169.1 SpoIIE family protein phosphatase [Nocardioides jiangsuensis]